jgi:hypothetical protein
LTLLVLERETQAAALCGWIRPPAEAITETPIARAFLEVTISVAKFASRHGNLRHFECFA